VSTDAMTVERIATPADTARAELAQFRASTGRDATGEEIRGIMTAHRAVASELAALATAADVRAFEAANRAPTNG
jgi:hypothetical protein